MHCRCFIKSPHSMPVAFPSSCQDQNMALDITKHPLGVTALDSDQALRTMAQDSLWVQAEGYHKLLPPVQGRADPSPTKILAGQLQSLWGLLNTGLRDRATIPKASLCSSQKYEGESLSWQSHTNYCAQTARCGHPNCCPGPHLHFTSKQDSESKSGRETSFLSPTFLTYSQL